MQVQPWRCSNCSLKIVFGLRRPCTGQPIFTDFASICANVLSKNRAIAKCGARGIGHQGTFVELRA
jgi:hypothetical protein